MLLSNGRYVLKQATFKSRTTSSQSLPQPVDLLHRYQALVTLGKIQHDEEQLRVVMELRRLSKSLVDYTPPAFASHYFRPPRSISEPDTDTAPWWKTVMDEPHLASSTTLVRVRSHAEELASLTTPKGLLLTGPPGAGKSLLVDAWFASVPTRHKLRKHYNELVLDLYRAVWEETQRRMASPESSLHDMTEPHRSRWTRAVRDHWRSLVQNGALPTSWARAPGFATASLEPTIAYAIARKLVLNHWLLVFDEVQLLDVSSAGLLADVLSWYWRMGGVVVGTSNKVPDDLYKNGVQRDRLEPFVTALKARSPVLEIRGMRDWRRHKPFEDTEAQQGTWYTSDRHEGFERAVEALVAQEEPRPQTLHVFGRELYVPWVSGGTCKFTFDELCNASLGSADYLTLASRFRMLVMTSIPPLRLADKDRARRLIALVDALYEARCTLLCDARVPLDKLLFSDAAEGAAELDSLMAEAVSETEETREYRPNVALYQETASIREREVDEPKTGQMLEKLSIFSGEDERFAFRRALSRMHEMTSARYAREAQWTPLPLAQRKWETANSSDLIHEHSSVRVMATWTGPVKRCTTALLLHGS